MKVPTRQTVAMTALFCVVSSAMPACTSSAEGHALVAPNVQFDRYHTFAFDTKVAPPPSYSTSSESPEARHEIQQTTTHVLESRGYVLAHDASPDVVIRVETGRRGTPDRGVVTAPNMQVQSEYFGWLDNEEQDLVEGAFVIDAFDAHTRKLLWHGAAHASIKQSGLDDERLRRSVERVLTSFPPSGR